MKEWGLSPIRCSWNFNSDMYMVEVIGMRLGKSIVREKA